ncbi:hypothetical protein EBR78_02060 [bacterium]|nr:hypothetical protein [bacterium]
MKKLILFSFFVCQVICHAGLLRPGYQFSRPTGMGNAFLALADDANALFYNPAALARVKGVRVHLVDAQLAVDNTETLTRLKQALFDNNTDGLIESDRQSLGLSIKPTLITPYFGLAIFDQAFGSFDLQNLQGDRVDVFGFNDLGIAVGFGIPFSDYFSFGFGIRAVQRSSIDIDKPTSQLISELGLDALTINSNPWNALKNYLGVGYAFPIQLGVLFRLPQVTKQSPIIRLAATVEDLGNTRFTRVSGASAPSTILASYNFGASLQYGLGKDTVLNITSDLRNQFRSLPLFKTFHLGTELRHKIAAIRGGIHQGYPTFGASLEFPPQTRIHFSTFSMELGDNLWQKEQRWYQIQLVIGFNPL